MEDLLQELTNKLCEQSKANTKKTRDFLKEHVKQILRMIGQIMQKDNIVINEFQYNLMVHLFNLCSFTNYIPSIFIKQVAEMSPFVSIELTGFFPEVKNQKKTQFLSLYYKIVSLIMNNKQIKQEKKKIFEKLIAKKLNDTTVQWLINLFTQSSNKMDDNTKILLKAITQTQFDFFEAFAMNFKKTLSELINSPQNNKNWMNKYVFKIIEKCLIKLPNIEKGFLLNLSKVCHSIIDMFIQKPKDKIKKLYRLSMRLMYIIYEKRSEKNSKIIKFFQLKFEPLFKKNLSNEFILEILDDFIQVNFSILDKKDDISDYYKLFYSLLLKRENEEVSEKYIECIGKIIEHELKLKKNQISDIVFIKQLLTDFNSSSEEDYKIPINIICRVIQNCPMEMKLRILEEISFSNFSFFSKEENISFLENLIDSMMENLSDEKAFDFYVKYLDLLFYHSINQHYSMVKFLSFIETVHYDDEKIFYLTLSFANKYFISLQETNKFEEKDTELQITKFIQILAIKSITIKQFPKQKFQDILNILAYFIIYKKFHFDENEFNSKFKLSNNEQTANFEIYFIIFTSSLPEIIFNQNTNLTPPIKIEINPLLLSRFSEMKKIVPSEFGDFGDYKDPSINTTLYLLCIYFQFISKFYLLNIFFQFSLEWNSENKFVGEKVDLKLISNERMSIISLLDYLTDNIFLYSDKNKEFFNKMFNKFFDKYFSSLKKTQNTQIKQKLMSYDLKYLLNFACYYHNTIRTRAVAIIKTYAKSFPFILNEYDIFEYCINILGILISSSVKDYGYFINKIDIDSAELNLPPEKKIINQIYSQLYRIVEKCLQKSHMINNNNITFNVANYMNQYTINPNDGMNYSVNLLQKMMNNIKKIEIPPMLKTSAYLEPEKFRNYLKTHVKKNFDKYTSLSNINDIYSPSDYAKSTKLQLRNKYTGIVEGKINNFNSEFNYDNDQCYYNFKLETAKRITKCFNEETEIVSLSNKITPILIEVTAFIVCAEQENFKTSFNPNIINDELINIITSVPLLLNNSIAMENARFCWEWILFLDKSKISTILKNILTSLKKKSKLEFQKESIKPKSAIFDLENTLDQSILIAKDEYTDKIKPILEEIFPSKIVFDKNKKLRKILIINETLNSNCSKISYYDYINGQILLLKFLKECMNEFCKCDIEKLQMIYEIIRQFVDLKISSELFRSPLYIYLHFFILNISLELVDIMEPRLNLFNISQNELDEFLMLLFLYGLRYFKFDKTRRIIENKFYQSEIVQTLINCEEILMNKAKLKILSKTLKKKNRRISNMDKVYTFVNSVQDASNKLDKNEAIEIYENYKQLLIFLIDNEINNFRYWNNPSATHKSTIDFSEEKIKKMFNAIFKYSNKQCIKLIERFPWIKKKYPNIINIFGEYVYNNKNMFINVPFAMTILIEYIINSKKKDLVDLKIMNSLFFWKFPSLNYALKYISLAYTGKFGLHKYCSYMLQNATTKAIIFYLPQLIQSLRTDTKNEVAKFILYKCKKSSMIAHQFLWALEVEEVMSPQTKKRYLPKGYSQTISSEEISNLLRIKILKNLNMMQRKFWYDENDIFGAINEVSGCFLHPEGEYSHLTLKMTKEEKTDFVRNQIAKITTNIQPYIYLPTNPDYRILSLLPHTAVTLQSAKKVPFIVSFDAIEYPGPDQEYLVNNMTIEQFVKNEYKEKGFNCLIFPKIDSPRQTVTSKEIINNAGILNTMSKNGKSEKNFGFSLVDLMNDEDIEGSDKPFENEKNRAIYVPTFEPRALHNKNDFENKKFFTMQDNIIRNEADQNNILFQNNADEIDSLRLRSGYSKRLNVFTVSKNDNVVVIPNEDDKIINQLNNCTLSDIDVEEEDNIFINVTKNHEYKNKLAKQSTINQNKIIHMSCIFKVGDDLRQDSLALQVIQIFQEIFNENNLNLYTFPYQTISTISPKFKDLGGFIEVVKDCDSRDQIGKTYDTNLYDYYLCSFGQEDSNEFRSARKNLIISLAAYGIISYILQIKDRHNGNILIDKYGHLIHIDFGFIFDISPGGNMRFERAAFKLTKEMIQIMEGTESEAYSSFVDLTVRAFLACRDYMDKLLDPVVLMFSSGLECFRDNSITNFIERFKLEMKEEEAANFMREEIKTAEDNWRTNLYDFIQKKQNNIDY